MLAHMLTQKLIMRHCLKAFFTPNSFFSSNSSDMTRVVARLIPEDASVIPNA